MADKLADNDLEDVLSSVRRLVSDEGVLRHVAKAPQADQDRLILTPALRVVAPGKDLDDDEVPELPASLIAPEEDDDVISEDMAEDLKALSALEATIAELEAAVDGHPEFEPDGGEESSVLDYPPKLVHGARAAAAAQDAPRRRLTLGVPAGVEDGEAEDDGAGDDEPLAEPVGTLRLVPRPEEAAPEAGEGEVDEVLLDEEALRQMVSEIVREELQGVMGERITSNIRKLIRREIHDYFDVRDDE